MPVRRVEDLVAFQLAVEFKLEVYRILKTCRNVNDFKYEGQLRGAAGDIEADLAEGFSRNVPGEFAQFVRYARGSLAEARQRLRDGIDRGYFSESDCHEALDLGQRCAHVTQNLFKSLEPFLKRNRAKMGRVGNSRSST